ncbi:hypothetical protein D0T66_15130 [Dysgonomonas sp. 25]|nr:hypothetical protein [Dysgonomonas sp. 25]
MLPRLLRRGYDCIFQKVTLVKMDLAKALCMLPFLFLHLKVEAIKRNIDVCVHPQIDISGRHTGLPLRSNEKRCFAFAQHDKANSYQSTDNNKILVGAKHRSAKRRRAKHRSPAISGIYGAIFIAPYKAITRSLAFAWGDNNRPPLSPRGGNGFVPPFNKKRKYILPLASPTGRFGGAQTNYLFTSSFSVTPLVEGGRRRWLIFL